MDPIVFWHHWQPPPFEHLIQHVYRGSWTPSHSTECHCRQQRRGTELSAFAGEGECRSPTLSTRQPSERQWSITVLHLRPLTWLRCGLQSSVFMVVAMPG